MGDHTKIEWTDATVNAINGCSVLSPGCTNCYAMRLAGTRLRDHESRAGLTIDTKAGPVWNGTTKLNEKALLQPLAWKRPRSIFWNAHGDLFHESVPDEWIDRQMAVIALTPQHVHQVLTKRTGRMLAYLTDPDLYDRVLGKVNELRRAYPKRRLGDIGVGPPSHWRQLWLGVSVEDQPRADERREAFRAVPGRVKFVSYEPALGPVDWTGWEFVNQIISGGESGPRARPSHPDWHRGARDFCSPRGIAYFFKQHGEWKPFLGWKDGVSRFADASGSYGPDQIHRFGDGHYAVRVGKKAAGRLLDGVQHDGVPA